VLARVACRTRCVVTRVAYTPSNDHRTAGAPAVSRPRPGPPLTPSPHCLAADPRKLRAAERLAPAHLLAPPQVIAPVGDHAVDPRGALDDVA
jgi:hypothetical protein